MPKLLIWRPEWSLGIDVLDKDHRALIDQLADICIRFCPEASHARSGDANALIDALAALGASMRAHFQREEALMRSFGYDAIGNHQSEHALLMAEFTAMLRDWRAAGLHVLDETSQGIVRDWLIAHILGADRTFAQAYCRLSGHYDATEQQRNLPIYHSSKQLSTKNAR